MTEQNRPIYEGRDPMEILAECIKNRPIPAIEKPLGRRGVDPVVVFDEDFSDTSAGRNDAMSKRG